MARATFPSPRPPSLSKRLFDISETFCVTGCRHTHTPVRISISVETRKSPPSCVSSEARTAADGAVVWGRQIYGSG